MKEKAISFLRATEKYTKTDMLYLFKGGFWLSIFQFMTSISALVVSIVFANYVSVDVYGMYKYVVSVSVFIGSFSLLGLGTTVIQMTARGEEGSFKMAIKQNIKWSWPLFLIAISGSIYYFFNQNPLLGWSLFAIGVVSPILNSSTIYASFLYGKKDFSTTSLFAGSVNILTSITVILLIITTKNALFIFLGFLISNTLFNIVATILTFKKHKPNKEATSAELKKFSLHQSFYSLLGTASSQIDKILLFQLLGSKELAIYSFAIAIPEQIRGLFKNFSGLALPNFANRTLAEIRQTIVRKILTFMIPLFIISIIYIILAPFVFRYIFPRYADSLPYSQIFALFIFSALASVPITAMQAKMQNGRLYIFSIISNILQIIADIVLIKMFGIWGAVASEGGGKTINLILATFILTRKEKVEKVSEEQLSHSQ